MKTILKETIKLDASGADAISQQISQALSAYPYLTRKDILRLQLGAEEILLQWMSVAGETEVELVIEKRGRWLNLSLTLLGTGIRCDPFSAGEGLGGGFADNLLATLGIEWIYQFERGQNSVYIAVEVEKNHQIRNVFLAMFLALCTSAFFRLLNDTLINGFQSYLIHPLLTIGTRFLTAVVSPMMLLAVVNGIISVGSPRALDRVGRYATKRFFTHTILVILFAAAVCIWCFPFQLSFQEESGSEEFYSFLYDIVPDNIVSPFIECNMIQIVVIGVVLGIAMLFLQRQTQTLKMMVEEGNTLICRMLIGFEKFLPIFVYLNTTDTFMTIAPSRLFSYGRMLLLLLLFFGVVVAANFIIVLYRLKMPARKLWMILKPSLLVQLASASSSVAFAEAYEACEQGFGIEPNLVRFALPIGTVMHKPLIAAEFIFLIAAAKGAEGSALDIASMIMLMFVAFVLSIAYPPVSSGEITCYTMLLLQMEMDIGLLPVACTLSSLFDILEAPGNTLCTELQLVLTAQRHGMIKRKQRE